MMPQQPSPAHEPDAVIVCLLQEKDPKGLQQLLSKYGGKVRSNLRHELGSVLDGSELDEVLNRAAYLVWKHAGTYKADRGKLATWFYIIARNAALAKVRRERSADGKVVENIDFSTLSHEAATALGHGQDSMQSAAGTNGETVAPSDRQQQYMTCLHDCIADLAPLQQQIIQADLQSGDVADAAELAQKLNTTKNSIYVSRSSARKNLRSAMRKRGFFAGETDSPA